MAYFFECLQVFDFQVSIYSGSRQEELLSNFAYVKFFVQYRVFAGSFLISAYLSFYSVNH